jgi:nucleotide-binding universal stress UspA family protein|tara:strand:+ start:4672 stop:5523 length:852 start_codon:yes stop_codon:yes gene_type:complete
MGNKLVALVDGSIYSKSVCENAAWLARRAGTPVEVLHVLGRRDVPVTDLSGSIALGARSALLADLAELDERRAKLSQQKGRAILEDAKAILTEGGVADVSTRLMNGDIVETLGDFEADAELIVIGKRGEGADFAKMHLGSNLERVVRSSKRPVFVAARGFSEIGSVLVAFDGGPSAMKAVDYIATSPVFAGVSIRLLTVGNESAEAAAKLESARARLAAARLDVTAGIQPGQPETVIADIVEQGGVDLLVMGAYGHSRIRSLFIGSTTSEMIRSCKIPVLLFR